MKKLHKVSGKTALTTTHSEAAVPENSGNEIGKPATVSADSESEARKPDTGLPDPVSGMRPPEGSLERRDILAESGMTPTASVPREETPEEKWEKAGISSDLIFTHVMQNKELFLGLMQRIFPELHLIEVHDHETQKSEYGRLTSKGVRFDVYSEIDGRCFDVEMQVVQRGDEPRRTRYYQCMMDMQTLKAGKSYNQLPDSYVVMIGQFDLFEKERHIYRFQNIEMNDHDLRLEDGTMKVFLNSKGTENDIPEELLHFLDLVNGNAPEDDFCRRVELEIARIKQDAQIRSAFMDMEDKLRYERERAREEGLSEGLDRGRQEGLDEGRQKGIMEALSALVRNKTITLQMAAAQAGVSESVFAKLLQEQT